jgi:hypothetical protein
MTTNDRERVLELFSEAIELPTVQQSAFLEKVAVEQAEVFPQLASLLELDRQAEADRFLESSALQVEAARLARADFSGRVGSRIGSFKLLELIGVGGMGAIYLAERDDDQYHRRVAIKVI